MPQDIKASVPNPSAAQTATEALVLAARPRRPAATGGPRLTNSPPESAPHDQAPGQPLSPVEDWLSSSDKAGAPEGVSPGGVGRDHNIYEGGLEGEDDILSVTLMDRIGEAAMLASAGVLDGPRCSSSSQESENGSENGSLPPTNAFERIAAAICAASAASTDSVPALGQPTLTGSLHQNRVPKPAQQRPRQEPAPMPSPLAAAAAATAQPTAPRASTPPPVRDADVPSERRERRRSSTAGGPGAQPERIAPPAVSPPLAAAETVSAVRVTPAGGACHRL